MNRIILAAAVRGAVLGLPVKTLGFDFAKVMHFLMGRPEITSGAELKGKRVGVSSFGAPPAIWPRGWRFKRLASIPTGTSPS